MAKLNWEKKTSKDIKEALDNNREINAKVREADAKFRLLTHTEAYIATRDKRKERKKAEFANEQARRKEVKSALKQARKIRKKEERDFCSERNRRKKLLNVARISHSAFLDGFRHRERFLSTIGIPQALK